MKALRTALLARYNSNAMLVRIGLKVAWGYRGSPKESGPHVDCTFVEGEGLDTFNDDLPTFDVTWTLFSKSPTVDVCDDWMEAMTDSFNHANILAAGFTCVGCERTGSEWPWYDDGTYRCRATWRVVLQRNSPLPVQRGT